MYTRYKPYPYYRRYYNMNPYYYGRYYNPYYNQIANVDQNIMNYGDMNDVIQDSDIYQSMEPAPEPPVPEPPVPEPIPEPPVPEPIPVA